MGLECFCIGMEISMRVSGEETSRMVWESYMKLKVIGMRACGPTGSDVDRACIILVMGLCFLVSGTTIRGKAWGC
jgi:hypothetical protein